MLLIGMMIGAAGTRRKSICEQNSARILPNRVDVAIKRMDIRRYVIRVIARNRPIRPQEEISMLTILGQQPATTRGFCDGISRRNFLTVGGMALGGINLSQALQAETQYLPPRRTTSFGYVGSETIGSCRDSW